MFNWIDNRKYITAINKKFMGFFLYLDNNINIKIDIVNNMDTENDFENNKILLIFINILDDFLDLMSSIKLIV